MKKTSLTFLFLFLFAGLSAQNLNNAQKLYKKKAYLEAAAFFLQEETKTQDIYEKLGDCFFFVSDMEKASKWYEKLMDTYQDVTSTIYYYRYSQALYGQNNPTEANKWLERYHSNKLYETGSINISKDYEHIKNEKPKFTSSKLISNTKVSEFGGTFLNNKLVFASSNNEDSKYNWNKEPYLNLFVADINNMGQLEKITPFSDEINTEKHESNAVFTKDGKTMYFTASNRDKLGKNKVIHLKIYRAELVDNKWQNITDLSINNTNYSTEHPALNKDETKLYFSSDRPGSVGSFDIYVVDILKNGKLSEPKNLGSKINTEHREQFPFIHKNNLFFASNGHIGLGGLDIFKTEIKESNTFTTPKNLGTGINSNLDDFAIVINENDSYGYFSSNRIGGVGSDDIYLFKREKEFITLHGIVKDKHTLEPIKNVFIELIKDENNSKDISSNIDGTFTFKIENRPNNTYNLKATKTLYTPTETSFDIKNIDENEPYTIFLEKYVDNTGGDIILKNNKTQIQHQPILFDLNSSYLTSKAKVILDQIVEVLNRYPEIVIRCESHTDSRSTDKYNLWLSKRRAKRTADYIISKGIFSNRISQEGFGETQLLNNCSNNVSCTEEEHQLNRRTEFVLITPKN